MVSIEIEEGRKKQDMTLGETGSEKNNKSSWGTQTERLPLTAGKRDRIPPIPFSDFAVNKQTVVGFLFFSFARKGSGLDPSTRRNLHMIFTLHQCRMCELPCHSRRKQPPFREDKQRSVPPSRSDGHCATSPHTHTHTHTRAQ